MLTVLSEIKLRVYLSVRRKCIFCQSVFVVVKALMRAVIMRWSVNVMNVKY